MRLTTLLIALLGVLAGCQKPISNDGRPPILTHQDQLKDYVGQLVTLQGEVSQSKIPQIIGADVAIDADDMPAGYAEATGVLFTWTVTAQSHAAMLVMGEHVATRGPGIYYSVLIPTALSSARPVLQSSSRTTWGCALGWPR